MAEKMGFWPVLDRVLGGQTITEAREDIRSDRAAIQAQEMRRATASKIFPDDPLGQQLWVAGHPKLLEKAAERYGTFNQGEGDVLNVAGKQGPKNVRTTVGVDGGFGYSGDAVSGVKFGPGRPKNHAETIRENLGLKGFDIREMELEQEALEHEDDIELGRERIGVQGGGQGAVIGRVLDKVATLGPESLTTGEAAIWERYQKGPENGGGWPMAYPGAPTGGAPPAPRPAPAPAPAPKPAPKPAAAAPAAPAGNASIPRPRTKAELDRLNKGDPYVWNGKVYLKNY